MRRSPRLFLVPLFVLAMLFSGVSSPFASGSSVITGFSDENVGSWPGPAWAAMNNTGVKQVRHIVPWNVANNAGELASLHAWVNTAEAHGLSVLISFNHSGTVPPSPTDYLNAVSKFRTEFPQIREYTAWNEPNHHPSYASESNPAGIGKAALAADYWVSLHYQCQAPKYGSTCTVAAGDFLESNDVANFNAYMDAYKKRISEYGLSPSVWAIHPYGAVASGSWSAINATFIPRTEGKPIWFTEVGAKVCDINSGLVGGSYPAAEISQQSGAYRLMALIASLGNRVARTYYYFLSPSNPGQVACPTPGGEFKLDTGLLDLGGNPRPAFKTLFWDAAHPPSLSTGVASGIGSTAATISGSVDPRGYHSYYRFEVGTTTSYGGATENQYAGFEPGAVGHSATIGNLQPGTTYHYRVVAWNGNGTTYGADQTFRTRNLPVVAIQANDSALWNYQMTTGTGTTTTLGMAPGTSPSVAGLPGGGYVEAVQANDSGLWIYPSATGVGIPTKLGMSAKTSPSVAALAGGGYAVALRANTGNLWTYSSATGTGTGTVLGMSATSPSIAGLFSGGYVVGFQANDGALWNYSSATGVGVSTKMGMAPGTGPAIAGLPVGGYIEAIHANDGALWLYSSATGVGVSTKMGMAPGTSPSVAALPGGGYVVAIHANDGALWLYSSATGVGVSTKMGMAPGTSPSIASHLEGGYTVAIHANDGALWRYSSATGIGTTTTLGMQAGTSPSVAAQE